MVDFTGNVQGLTHKEGLGFLLTNRDRVLQKISLKGGGQDFEKFGKV